MAWRNSAILSFCFFLILPVLALGQTVTFVDQQGAPTTVYLEGATAFVRVDDPAANLQPSTVETVNVALAPGAPGNGVVETTEDPGPPHRFDTVRAIYDPGEVPRLNAAADLLGSRTWFIDGNGVEVSSYPGGSAVWVRVEDQNVSLEGQLDSVQVTVTSSPTGDAEDLLLSEVDPDGGIFEGTLILEQNASATGQDGFLQAQAAVNKTGTTQFRVYFALDDNDDRKADYMGYYGGDDVDPANHPQLVLLYQE